MSASTPWKLAVTGGVGIVAGVALLSVDWTLASLAAFAGLALVARGALHLVATAPFLGFAGAFAVLEVAGDVGVGITALAWPEPTLLSLALLVGSWAIVRAIVGGTIAVTTRAEHPSWLLSLVFAIIAVVLGVILIGVREISSRRRGDHRAIGAARRNTRDLRSSVPPSSRTSAPSNRARPRGGGDVMTKSPGERTTIRRANTEWTPPLSRRSRRRCRDASRHGLRRRQVAEDVRRRRWSSPPRTSELFGPDPSGVSFVEATLILTDGSTLSESGRGTMTWRLGARATRWSGPGRRVRQPRPGGDPEPESVPCEVCGDPARALERRS